MIEIIKKNIAPILFWSERLCSEETIKSFKKQKS